MSSTNDRPLHTIRDGAVKVTIWVNRTDDDKIFHSVVPGRTYTDDDGNAKSANSYSGTDILKLRRLCDKAYDYIAAKRLEEQQQQETA